MLGKGDSQTSSYNTQERLASPAPPLDHFVWCLWETEIYLPESEKRNYIVFLFVCFLLHRSSSKLEEGRAWSQMPFMFTCEKPSSYPSTSQIQVLWVYGWAQPLVTSSHVGDRTVSLLCEDWVGVGNMLTPLDIQGPGQRRGLPHAQPASPKPSWADVCPQLPSPSGLRPF